MPSTQTTGTRALLVPLELLGDFSMCVPSVFLSFSLFISFYLFLFLSLSLFYLSVHPNFHSSLYLPNYVPVCTSISLMAFPLFLHLNSHKMALFFRSRFPFLVSLIIFLAICVSVSLSHSLSLSLSLSLSPSLPPSLPPSASLNL